MTITLERLLEAIEEPTKLKWFAKSNQTGERTKVELIDDWGMKSCTDMDNFFLIGHEYGPTHLVCADSMQSAEEAWLDEQPTIPMDDEHEAYNAYDMLRDELTGRGNEDTIQLRNFCNRWAKTYFDIITSQDNAWDDLEMDESYDSQPNATGTGVVNVGHYHWIKPLVDSGYSIEVE